MSNTPWSQMSPHEHLDAAGALFAKHAGDNANGLHKDLIEATAHVNAALVLSEKA